MDRIASTLGYVLCIFSSHISKLFLSNFENVTSATYGACYSINSNLSGDATSLWRSSLPGPDLGLTIVVNLDQVQYLQNRITKSAGARYLYLCHRLVCTISMSSALRVIFHNASVRPLVNEFGYDLQPQTSTNFALHTVREE